MLMSDDSKLASTEALHVTYRDQRRYSDVSSWILQIQKDAMLDKFLPAVPFLDTVQTPCIMAVGKHHEDGRFMATFLNQVQLCATYTQSVTHTESHGVYMGTTGS